MKYTKLFNQHSEYVAYTASTSFIRPNVSWCIQEREAHCTPKNGQCTEQHVYEIMGEPSYPSTVPASATSFDLSFTYSDTYTATTCEEGSFMDGDTVTIGIEANPTTSARTISGAYVFHNISIPYSFTQEGKEELPYNQQYLTFDVLSGGTILWVANSGETKTISYSINDGEWTQITSTAEGASINVSAGDKARIKGNNARYASAKDTASMFSGGTAAYDVYGNIMSLIGGDNFSGLTSFNGQQWAFHDLFNTSNVVSAKNLIMPVTTLTSCCYRAMFAHAKKLTEAPELPATTLASSGYCYMFQDCTALQKAPDLLAETIVGSCYIGMFNSASTLNYIKCTATSGVTTGNTKDWTKAVSNTGTFIRAANVNWTSGVNGIPTGWLVQDDGTPDIPTISCNGLKIELSCATTGADIYYKLTSAGSYSAYTTPIIMTGDTDVWCYSEKDGMSSTTTSMTCEYDDRTIYEYANQSLDTWTRSGSAVTVPNSVNAIDGHSSNYAKGTFNYETTVNLRDAEPTYLWFQHADHKAEIYVDNTLVDTHWGGYTAFFSDISQYTHEGTNHIKVALKNNNGNYLAPASGDFNFNATLGKVKLFTSPYMPAMNYGYDGFHITSTVSSAEATINVKTSIPTGATVVCTISGTNCNYTATSASTNNEMTFTTTITNPHLWNGKSDPYLYNVKLEIYHDNELYHRYERSYGLRFYEYVINDTEKYGTAGNPYTGFLLNGQPYLLRGCCMHDDIANKANALNDVDYTQTFNIIQELGLNFLRLAHYPHPKEVYDWCDRLGIVVQTEGPCVNKLDSTMPTEYYDRLNGQYTDMVNQHYNHPCIFFWGLSNETTTNDKAFGKTKIEGYTSLIKSLDSERMVGYVLAQSPGTSPSAYYNDPSNVDWFGCNIYVGWYDSPNSNNPTSQINTRLNNTINRAGVNKPMAYSEYGCGGTQACHSDDFMNTTTRGNNPRHDIEYQMWLHEGHIAAIKNFPQLLYTSQWQLFDIAVASRNEGYTVCLDGVNTSTDDSLRRLNNKGLVERDHVTKKDTFYLYKAWWNTTDIFVHICGKNYTKSDSRVIKCYTNETGSLTMYINGTSAETVSITNNIATFTSRNFDAGDTIMVSGATSNDSFTIGHAFVDLGLPSGTKWATMNVGANSMTDYGNYYQYGKGADDYFVTSGQSDYSGIENPLATSADTAAQVWGGNWHMPTSAQCQELINNTTYSWETNFNGSGINGGKFTAQNGNYIFFPANGQYWSGKLFDDTLIGSCLTSTPYTSGEVYKLKCTSGNIASHIVSSVAYEMGSGIRPVKDEKYDSKIEYLSGDGHQYIDTNIVPDSSTGIKVTLNPDIYNYTGENDTYIVGLRDGSNSNTRWCLGKAGDANWGKAGVYYGYGNYAYFGVSQLDNDRYYPYGTTFTLSLNFLNSKYAVNGERDSISLPSTMPFTATNVIRIFGSSGVDANYTKYAGKIYSVQISQGNQIVMDLIPVRVGNVGYMFDKISGNLYGNDGTGSFTLGPDVN